MQIQDIKRVAVKDPEIGEDVQEFALRAKSVLGYNVLAEYKEKLASTRGGLLSALVALQIEILDYQQVKLYQLEKKHEAERAALPQFFEPSRYRWGRTPNFEWRQTELKKYGEPIPEFVLRKAVQLKETLPEVELFIEQLEEQKDPFLFVKLGEEEFYIEVWDEPRFEGRL